MKKITIPNTFYGRFEPAIFRKRLHRFAAEVEFAGKVEVVHIPNSGRLQELLFPGNQVGLHFEGHPKRQTRFTLVRAAVGGGWAYIDSRLSNRILKAHWRDLPPLAGYDRAWPEVVYGVGRFDLGLCHEATGQAELLEAKCVTLVEEGTGRFPDAPTERGRRHLQELARAVGEGFRGLVIFFAQHPTAEKVGANHATDPAFAARMAEARAAGVEFCAYRVEPGDEWVELTEIPVIW
ncbi:MAG TPA: DNA/RNA nuclease SfsA [Bacillota bacterium]|nr:DNA/RNA nuclease SfsA [Bacillota bacterium]